MEIKNISSDNAPYGWREVTFYASQEDIYYDSGVFLFRFDVLVASTWD